MTPEEKAEEKYQEHINKENCYVSKSDEKIYTDGFLDGLAEGKPKWHDLRKDPNDLPKKEGAYYCMVEQSAYGEMLYQGYKWIDMVNAEDPDVIAWCELPKFEEE